MKILISAYGCGPGRGSEPGVGWNWTNEVARHHQVWVLTPESERAPIENYRGSERSVQLTFVHCDLPRFLRFSNQDTQIRYHLHYNLWQIYAFFVARHLHRKIGFNLAHHLILGAHWKPSFLCLLPIPFIWGPLGGGESTPAAFLKRLPLRHRLVEFARSVLRKVCELDPSVRLTARRSRLVLTKTRDTASRVELLGASNVQVFSEAGLPSSELDRLGSLPVRTKQPFRFVSIGRLIYWKGASYSLRAFANCLKTYPTSEFLFVGDGPERKNVERLAKELGISTQVQVTGWLERAGIFAALADCDVLVHASLHDSGGWACVEAMAARRPVVCLDLGGPAVQVTNDAGIKVQAINPEQATADLGKAMSMLAGNRDLVHKMGEAGRSHVLNQYAWKKKAIRISSLYEQLGEPKDCERLTSESAAKV